MPDLSAGADVRHDGSAASRPALCDRGGRAGGLGLCSAQAARSALSAVGAAGLCWGTGDRERPGVLYPVWQTNGSWEYQYPNTSIVP